MGIGSRRGEAVKWDYVRHPVAVTENRPAPDARLGICVASAFDGYGALGSKPACTRAWHQGAVPTDKDPLTCEIDYGKPTLVTAFVHYFYVPGSRDMRFTAPGPSAMKKVRILARNDSGAWQEITTLSDLPSGCPQILPTGATKPWRFWKIEVLALAPGAEFLCTYELETYTGGIPKIAPCPCKEANPLVAFADRISRHKPSENTVPAKLILANQDPKTLGLKTEGTADAVKSELHLLIDGKPVALTAAGDGRWQADIEGGRISLETKPTALGLLLQLRFSAKEGTPVKYQRASLQLNSPGTQLYYMPAYAWSRSPVDTMVQSCHVQTRMAALGFKDAMLCLLPGTDRGTLGFVGRRTPKRSSFGTGCNSRAADGSSGRLVESLSFCGGRGVWLSRAAANGAGQRNAVWHLPVYSAGRRLGTDFRHDEIVARDGCPTTQVVRLL